MSTKRIPDPIKNQIRADIIRGIPYEDICQQYDISRSTVNRIKREMPVMQLPTDKTGKELSNDDSILYDNTTFLTKKEEEFTKKLKDELFLYEDQEEGWVFHLTKADYRLRTSGLWWSAIVYPESAPENWIELLRNTGLRIAISPLHDKDWWDHDSPAVVNPVTGEIIPKGARYKAGDPKKPHWHIIVVADKTMSAIEANHVIRSCTHGPYVQKCRSLKNAYDYFLHINAPEKYQKYDKTEIQEYNNFHLEPNKYEKGILTNEILRYIRENKVETMYELVDHYLDQIEYICILNSKPFLVTSLIHAQWNLSHPEGKIRNVRIIKEVKNDEQR